VNWLTTRRACEDGATAVEYALMVTLIAVVISAVVLVFGQEVTRLLTVPANAFRNT
jgi:Flp pilus assembly pilin Flp